MIKRAQEAELEEVKRKRGIDPDEALEMERVLRKISEMDLEKIAERKYNELSPMDRMVEDLKANKEVGRALRYKKKAKAKPKHWTQKKAAKRKYDRTRYREVLKPKRKRERAELLQSGAGWWEYQNRIWAQNGVEVRMTEEEFTTVVYPAFGGRVPVLERYDKTRGISLDNLLVRDSDTREVIWDGKEYSMKVGGWIL